MTALYILNLASAAYASAIACFLLVNSDERWSRPSTALVNGAAALSLLYLACFAVLA